MRKKLVSMKSSQFEAFQKNALSSEAMQKITGGDGVYPGSYAGSSETKKTYDANGKEIGCQIHYDTQQTDPKTLKRTWVYGDWQQCGTTTVPVGK